MEKWRIDDDRGEIKGRNKSPLSNQRTKSEIMEATTEPPSLFCNKKDQVT